MSGQGVPRTTAAKVLKALAQDGWTISRQSGSHAILRHPAKNGIVTVPIHPGDLASGTIAAIIKSADLTAEEFKTLL